MKAYVKCRLPYAPKPTLPVRQENVFQDQHDIDEINEYADPVEMVGEDETKERKETKLKPVKKRVRREFTGKERQLIREMYAKGKSTKEIAEETHSKVNTIQTMLWRWGMKR